MARAAVPFVLAIGLASAFPSCEAGERQAGAEAGDAQRTAIVTGANRGLGLEFAKQLTAAGYRVIGTARKPDEAAALRETGARVERLDVADTASVRDFAKRLEGAPVDLLINNAGILVREGGIEEIDVDSISRSFDVNSLGPLRVTQALLPNLRRGNGKLVVHITSSMGSIERNGSGGYYAYRASKAALNMLNRSLAHELGGEGFVSVVLHPGWVRTDMGGPNARLSPEESISGMLAVIAGLSAEDNGAFFDHAGERVPW